VSGLPEVRRAENGGEVLDLYVPRSLSVGSTSDGRYYLRVADESKPVLGDEVMRLAAERAAIPWETVGTRMLPPSGMIRRARMRIQYPTSPACFSALKGLHMSAQGQPRRHPGESRSIQNSYPEGVT
jgi:hypothetical protein